MKKHIVFPVLIIFFALLLGCICPPNDWEGPWPPWCEKGESWERPKTTQMGSDTNTGGEVIDPFEEIQKIVAPAKTEYDTNKFVPKELDYIGAPENSEKNIVMGAAMHDIWGKYCIGEPQICEETLPFVDSSFERLSDIGAELVLISDFTALYKGGEIVRPHPLSGAHEVSEAELKEMTDKAHELGLKMMLITNLYEGENGARAEFDNSIDSDEYASKAFGAWKEIMLAQAKKAQNAGVDYFIVNSRDMQLDSFSNRELLNREYGEVLKNTKENFSGKVCVWGTKWLLSELDYTVDADCVIEDYGVNVILDGASEDVNSVKDKWIEYFSTGEYASFEGQEIFQMILMPSYDGATKNGWIEPGMPYPAGKYKRDFKEQAIVYEGFFRAIEESEVPFYGIISYSMWWHNSLWADTSEGNAFGHSIRNKDAEQVFYNWAKAFN